METVEDRILRQRVVAENGCWIWTGHTSKGYGRMTIDSRSRSAHRTAYELWVGPIPDGLHIDHHCNTPLCVNPEHMEPVTCEVNLMRGTTTQARINSEKTHCPQGHPYSGSNLRLNSKGGRYCLTCKRDKTRANRARMRKGN